MSLAYPAALWLLPAALAVLVLLQLYRSRRREILAGSLLLWRRVAAQERAPRRRLIVLDLAFWLQAAILAALALALADPQTTLRAPVGRRVAVLLDNGPAARARRADGTAVWDEVRATACASLDRLAPGDRVALLASSPWPHRLDASDGLAPQEVRTAAEALSPALSGPATAAAWTFLQEAAREFGGSEGPAAAFAFSPRAAPEGASVAGHANWRTLGPGPRLDNAGLTEFGSERTVKDGQAAVEALVQVRNFSASGRPVQGRVVLESLDKRRPLKQEQPLRLEAPGKPGALAGAPFFLPGKDPPPIRISWKPEGGPDALPEDDTVCAAPRLVAAPRVRLNGAAPDLETLYRKALDSELLRPGTADAADLEIYVEGVPEELPAGARAALFLAPAKDWGNFEVGPGVFKAAAVFPGKDDPLLRDFHASPEGLGFAVNRAREIKPAGDLKVLLQDGAGRLLAARFRLSGGRPCYVLASVPGVELGGPEQMPLAALLLRMLREAAGSGEPYAVERAAKREAGLGAALPLDWTPALDLADGKSTGVGVLDESASDLTASLGRPQGEGLELETRVPAPRQTRHALWPWPAGLAVLLILLELWIEAAQQGRPVRNDSASSDYATEQLQ